VRFLECVIARIDPEYHLNGSSATVRSMLQIECVYVALPTLANGLRLGYQDFFKSGEGLSAEFLKSFMHWAYYLISNDPRWMARAPMCKCKNISGIRYPHRHSFFDWNCALAYYLKTPKCSIGRSEETDMKTAIYWFSGAGSTYHVAAGLMNGIEDAELIPVVTALDTGITPVGRIGLVFPVYAWGPPVAVSRLIEKLPENAADYLFAVAVYAGAPGSAISFTRKMLECRGLKLNAAFSVKMVEIYPPMGGPPEEEKQARINSNAEKEIDQVITLVNESACGDFSKKNLIFSLIGRFVYPKFRKALANQSGDKFSVVAASFTKKTCARICPVGNIDVLEGEKPAWSKHCEQCYACFHWCPVMAIQSSKKTPGTRRYHHPETSMKDLMLR